MKKKIVLAYSGGLDTSVILKWLQEKYKAQVIALACDLGQGKNLASLKKKALAAGASKVYIENVKEEFIKDFIFPALQAGAVYEGKYFLSTALARPLIAKKLVEVARKEKAYAVAHGCTGKGNDQVRFDVSVAALAPRVQVIAPVREWELKSREEEIEYARKHKISVPVTKKKPYSIDWNLWGISVECGPLEDPASAPPEDIYQITVSPRAAPAKGDSLRIYFERGIPKKLNGKTYSPEKLIKEVNKRGGAQGIGRVDLVENRLVGIKSREVYECPAATILHLAHKEMESLVLDRETNHFKELISQKYAQLIYYGLWYSPLREALDSFVEKTQERVTGTVKLKLYKGNCLVSGRESKFSLYEKSLATYEKGDLFDHQAGRGFTYVWGLPLKIQAIKKRGRKKKGRG